ncbi:hypothetical protein KCP71_07175 [Salmonella enterica subsp. enterica]|nr:hypothetical protein KCP71_07175 [Salmonella enterica subsp. enterica]
MRGEPLIWKCPVQFHRSGPCIQLFLLDVLLCRYDTAHVRIKTPDGKVGDELKNASISQGLKSFATGKTVGATSPTPRAGKTCRAI